MKRKNIFYIVLITLIISISTLLYYKKFRAYSFPIDLVYTWVDGNDNKWLAKKNYWQKKLNIIDQYAIGKERFRDREELKHSLRSIELYMPWVRNIYIVTDNQIPKWLNTNHPKIKIIDHKDILPQDALPVFNSMAIEIGLVNIKGLSEHFIYFNDDVFVNTKLTPDFFFNKDGTPIIYDDEDLKNYGLDRIKKNDQSTWVKLWKKTIDTISIKYNTPPFVIVGTHTASVFNKTDLKFALNEFKENFEKTAYSKFRSTEDHSLGIADMINFIRKKIILRHYKNVDPKFNCSPAGILIMNNLNQLKTQNPCLFCLNDANYKNDDDSYKHTIYLKNRFPNKSSFEK